MPSVAVTIHLSAILPSNAIALAREPSWRYDSPMCVDIMVVEIRRASFRDKMWDIFRVWVYLSDLRGIEVVESRVERWY